MAKDTWNFPCYTCNDWGDDEVSTRGGHGQVWAIGPEVSTLQPFTNTITGIFSIFMRSGWSDITHTLQQHFSTIGGRGTASWGFNCQLSGTTGGSQLHIDGYDIVGVTARNQVRVGDENGTDWLQADKWYQFGFSMSDSAFTYAVNGVTNPKNTVVSAVNGDLNLDSGSDRWWYHSGTTANSGYFTQSGGEQLLIKSGWPTFIVGAAAWSTQYIDWSDATARGRVFDSNGDFKNPGEDGSLWFGDTYGANTPEFYFLDGSPRRDNGSYNTSIPQVWIAESGGGAGSRTATGGLRKQYENQIPDDWWVYASLSVAEASGDAWVDGDTIYIAPKALFFVYLSALAVDSYSGLIHKFPFGNSEGEVSSATVKGSEGADTDPDTWTDITVSASSGSQGVDYELDTDGGVSRIRDLTNGGYIAFESTYNITSADTETFRVIDLLEVVTAVTTAQAPSVEVRCYVDASNYSRMRITPFGTPNNPWHYERVSAGGIGDTGLSSNTPRRAFLYAKAGRCCVWFDEASTFANSFNPVPAVISGSGVAQAQMFGGTNTQSPFTLKLGTDVFGTMVTA